MNTDKGRLNFATGIDNSQLRADAAESKNILHSIGNSAQEESNRMDASFGKIAKAAGGIFAVSQGTEFAKQIISVRGEIESLQISFETLAGKDKGSALFEEIRQFAVSTPMMMKDLAQGAQTMLAFNIEAEKVMPILRALGDISMGDAQKFNSLTLAFSQMSATGKLMGQDLLQMINAGFNPLSVISEKTGKSIGELKEEMEKGKISVEMVTDAFMSATAAGGKFHGMLEKQSHGINGAISNLQGAIDDMLNDFGESSQGIISGAIDGATYLVKNYERVGRVLLSLIGTYGVYKVAVMAATAIENARKAGLFALTLAEHGHKIALLATEKAQKLLNATMLKNPYVLVATAIAGVVTALIAMESETERAKRIADEYNDTKQATIDKEQEHRSEMEKLLSVAGNEVVSTDKRREALNKLREAYPEIFAKYKTEIEQLEHIRDIKQEIANLDAQRSITNPKVELDTINQRIAELDAKKIKHYKIFGDAILSSDEETEYSQLYKRKRKLETQIAKTEVKDFYSNLSTATDNELKVFQSKMANALAAMQMQGKKYFTFSDGLSKGLTFSKEEIGAFADQIKNEINRRGTEKFTPSEYIAQAKKAVNVARKELNDYINNSKDKVDEMTFNKEVERLKQNLKDAEERYKKISASSGGSGKTDKQTDIVKEQQKLEDELTKLKQANEDERIALLAEGHDKELEIIENAYEKQKSVIAKQAEEWKSANVKAKVQTEENGLTTDQNKAINQANSLNDSKRDDAIKKVEDEKLKAEQASMNEYLRIYGEYHEKRLAITEYYNEQIKNASTKGEEKMLTAKMREELSALDVEAKKTTSSISKLFDDMSNKTVVEMLKIADKGQKALDFLVGGEWDEEKGKEFGITKETFELWSKSPEQIDKIREAIKRVDEGADASENAFKRIGDGIRKAFDATTPQDFMKALEDIRGGLEPIMQATSFVANAFSSLGDAFGSGAMTGIADGLNIAMDSLNQAMSGAMTGGMLFGPIGAMAGATIGLVSSLASAFAKLHDARHEKEIQKLQNRIDTLEKSYDNLGDKVEEAYSKDASKMIEQQNTLLEQQKAIIQQQIAEEKSKKKVDEERIKDWENQIEDIDKLIGENKDKAIDAIFGEDLKSAIENFADAYADAWANGTDSATSTRDVVKKMMQSMVKESINAAIQSSNAMQKIRDKLKEFFADNVLSEWEQNYVYNMAEKLQEDLDKQFGWAQSLFEEDQERQAEKKGIATASQESVDELNGRMTAIQGHTFSINETTKLLLSTTQSILQSVMNIESETDGFGMRLERMESSVKGMAATLDEIATRGIRIKN